MLSSPCMARFGRMCRWMRSLSGWLSPRGVPSAMLWSAWAFRSNAAGTAGIGGKLVSAGDVLHDGDQLSVFDVIGGG